MSSNSAPEHFVTLFDSHYLLQGLSLHRSLDAQGAPFHLWVVALDEDCAGALRKLALPSVTVIPVAEIENARLLLVKPARSVAEYCWTLTPFVPGHILERAPQAERVTYLDADLFFFDRWEILIDEFRRSGKHVLITEHAFAPEYADRSRFGRFCVQFMTFRNTDAGRKVMRWWQDRCIEWCYAREEDGKFGDQKYLDAWPALFPQEVHVLEQRDRTVAPWNVASLARGARVRPVFYHFHSLKLVGPRRVLLHDGYLIGRGNRWIYDRYVDALRSSARALDKARVPLVWRPSRSERLQAVRDAVRRLAGTRAWARL
jgi:hypothetical protein